MKTLALALLFGSAGLTLWRAPTQEPQSPPAPTAPTAPASPTPPAAAKPVDPVPHSPLEGVYTLHSRTIDGNPAGLRSRGYVAITRRHLLLCLVGEGADTGKPLLRAGVRSWEPEKDDLVRTEFRLGFFTDAKGGIFIEPPGTAEVKRIELIRGGVRIWQDERSYLDFERLE